MEIRPTAAKERIRDVLAIESLRALRDEPGSARTMNCVFPRLGPSPGPVRVAVAHTRRRTRSGRVARRHDARVSLPGDFENSRGTEGKMQIVRDAVSVPDWPLTLRSMRAATSILVRTT